MATQIKLELDHAGLAEFAKGSEMQRLTRGTAGLIAAAARAQGHTVTNGEPLPIEVSTSVTDRARAAVTIAHAAGQGMQSKHGVLTKAAAAVGLEVRDK